MRDDLSKQKKMAHRFRGYLPVTIDIETAGFNAATDAILEIAAVIIKMNDQGNLYTDATHAYHVLPFAGANLDKSALEFTGIDPLHPFRYAIDEAVALKKLFQTIAQEVKMQHCQRAVLVGHNAWFDLSFINAAIKRHKIKDNPFHQFTTFDTATLSALAYGQTVLARAADAAKIAFDRNSAHSAIYDAEKTADLFCNIINRWHELAAKD